MDAIECKGYVLSDIGVNSFVFLFVLNEFGELLPNAPPFIIRSSAFDVMILFKKTEVIHMSR